jgi:alpha-tubulin suppressor-like RCC1 family protein
MISFNRILSASCLLLVACGRYADSPATPTQLSGVHADSIVNGVGALCLSNAGKVSCLSTGGAPTLSDEPDLAGAKLITGSDVCGVTPDGALRCIESGTDLGRGVSRPGVQLASVAITTYVVFYVDTGGGLHADTGWKTTDIALDGANATQVAASDDQLCAVLSDGTARCWSYETQYLTQQSAESTFTLGAAEPLPGLSGVTQLVMYGSGQGSTTKCALAGGQVQCWGFNEDGQCGTGSAGAAVTTPTTVVDPHGTALHDVASLDLSGSHGCAVIRNGDLDCWGADVTTHGPHAALGLLKNIKQVSLGAWGTDAAVTTDGTVLTWGGTHQVGPDLSINPPLG